MYTILKYIGSFIMTLMAVGLVEKFMPNLEITEELTLFMFASLYLNIINLINNRDLKAKVEINQLLNTRFNIELNGEERCMKAAEKVHKECLKAFEEDD